MVSGALPHRKLINKPLAQLVPGGDAGPMKNLGLDSTGKSLAHAVGKVSGPGVPRPVDACTPDGVLSQE